MTTHTEGLYILIKHRPSAGWMIVHNVSSEEIMLGTFSTEEFKDISPVPNRKPWDSRRIRYPETTKAGPSNKLHKRKRNVPYIMNSSYRDDKYTTCSNQSKTRERNYPYVRGVLNMINIWWLALVEQNKKKTCIKRERDFSYTRG